MIKLSAQIFSTTSCKKSEIKTGPSDLHDNLHTALRFKGRDSCPEVFCLKVFIEVWQNSLKNASAGVSFLIKLQALACNFIKKETLVQVFSYEFCEISENVFSYRTPPLAASKRAL